MIGAMPLAWWGGLLGGGTALGLVLVAVRLHAGRRPSLADRVVRYVHVTPLASKRAGAGFAPGTAVAGIAGPWLSALAGLVDRGVGGTVSVQRRLVRSGSTLSVPEFRVQQVIWGLCGFAVVAALGLATSWSSPASWPLVVVVCLFGFAIGVLVCDQRLSSRATRRERQVVEEFPIVAELLALAVAAGEGPVQALTRVVGRTSGPLAQDLAAVLAQVRTGQPLSEAFEAWGDQTGLPVVNRFARSVAIAVERGTPLADVLHAQVGDVREANRRELIESAARREVAMMVPVVFLVLPVVIVFAFFPGLVGLSLTVS